ncbi:MAG: phenylalanine--tRNA ligase subunit beta [Gammaproteobacteria bacterium]|nr:phenylalanine--tRNA ligase subunit beta [Gammaproteobacteria bacterium]
MKFSERWLREWVDPAVDTDGLCDQLTGAGLEVDGVSPAHPGFEGVVVGQVLQSESHPAAEHLRVCTVDHGAGTVAVVCGAPNVRTGVKAPLARTGARLPGTAVARREIQGVVSDGMLCSAAELDLGDDGDGILELPDAFALGEELGRALGLADRCIELDLTPNRGDCLSLRGIAREVGVLNDTAVRAPECPAVAPTLDDVFPVEIDAGEGCPRYLSRVIRGVDVRRPTPVWLRERLRRSGLRSIDPVVDVTNYVLLELGQPMHAFDLDSLQNRVVVRWARPGESLEMLDGREVALEPDTLLITDDRGPVGMAGVMGGANSAVGPGTRNIFMECAYFAPDAIHGTARGYGLQTDASQRYERGVDPTLQEAAMERAIALLIEVAGGEAGPVVVTESRAHLPEGRTVRLRRRRLDLLVGEVVPDRDVDRIFERLEFAPRREDGEDGPEWRVTAPAHRFDIAIEEDLVEEVCRIYGYNRIGQDDPAAALPLRRIPRDVVPQSRLADALVAAGYREAITYSFVEPALVELLAPDAAPVRIANPMSVEQSVMRTSLLPGLLGALRTNLARQQNRVRLFELGQCFPEATGAAPEASMVLRVGGIACGPRYAESWATVAEGIDFHDVKGDVELLLDVGGLEYRIARSSDRALHPGQSAAVFLGDREAGRFGRLHPEVESVLDLELPVFAFEFDADALVARRAREHRPVPRFPRVRRDLAIVVDRAVSAGEVESAVRQVLGDILNTFTLFDVYQGKSIDSNEKSLGVGLTLQHPSRTLAEDDITRYVDMTLRRLKTDFGARLR